MDEQNVEIISTPKDLNLNKILIVDDIPMNLQLMEIMFRDSGYEIILADSGQEGLAKARQGSPFLIISDIQMPGMSGFELCKRIKADDQTKNAAVIFVTAHARSSKQVREGLEMGADEYISRPFEREELLARVQAVARLKRAELEAQRQAALAAQHSKGLELLNELAMAITSSLDLQEILTFSMQKLSQIFGAEMVAILMPDEKTQKLIVNIALAGSKGTTVLIDLEPGLKAVDLAEQEISAILVKILDDRANGFAPTLIKDLNAITTIPMVSKKEAIGAIAMVNKQSREFTADEWSQLISAASIITVAVENAQLFSKVQNFNRRLERKVQERTRELAEEKDKVEAILSSMVDGVLVLDANKRIVTLNAAAQDIFSSNAKRLIGMPITSQELASPLWDCVRNLADGPEATATGSADVPSAAKPRGYLSIQAHSARVRTETGESIGMVIVLSDVTAILEVERMKARFMAGVTHELKTPLAVIRLHTNNLTAYHARLPEEKREQLLSAIQGQVRQLTSLVEDILKLSRFDAVAVNIERQSVNLNEISGQVVDEMRPLALEKGLALHWSSFPSDIILEADPKKLSWLISNLIDNAIKYTPAGGSVTVQLALDIVDGKKSTLIQVIDTGIGISPEEYGRLFERFYRVDSSHTIPGTGLGLSIVKEIANAHGGTVSVVNSQGGGSRFTVTLPL